MNTEPYKQLPLETDADFSRRILRQNPPTAEQLATIAAPLVQRHKGDTKAAVDEAISLWVEAVKKVRIAGKLDHWSGLNKPARFPVDFKSLLRCMMAEIPASDRFKRFKDFVAPEPIENYKNLNFNEKAYLFLVRNFNAWWAKETTRKRREARASRKRGD